MTIHPIKQLLNAVIAVAIFLLMHFSISAQTKSLFITHYNSYANQDTSKDSFRVQTLVPADISQLIDRNAKVVIFIYKPYCPGIKEYFEEEASFLQKAGANGYFVIFLATSTEGLAHIPEIISKKYNLNKLNYYVIDESINRRNYERVTLQGKKTRDVIIIRNGQFIHNAWSYELSHEDEQKL